MKSIPYHRDMTITNIDQLAKGTGAKFLEVLDNQDGTFIAVQWRRKPPKQLTGRRRLIAF